MLSRRSRLLALGLGGVAVLGMAAEAARRDHGKYVVEVPVKQVLAKAAPASHVVPGDFVNPRVQPGLVRWHTTFADACAAARLSGKPVLLFQMMGKLDAKFC